MQENNIEMIRGDSFGFGIEIGSTVPGSWRDYCFAVDTGRAQIDPSKGLRRSYEEWREALGATPDDVYSIIFTVKRNFADETAAVMLYYLGEDDRQGISRADTGLYRVYLDPGRSEQLEAGQYYYDTQIACNGSRFTVLYGILQVYEDVTKNL